MLRPYKQCRRCRSLTRNESGYCDEHQAYANEDRRDYDKDRDKRTVKFYHSSLWVKVRAMALQRDYGLCQVCLKKSMIHSADLVHHIVEIKEDWGQRILLDNLVSLCNMHHNQIHHGAKKYVNDFIEFYPNNLRQSIIPLTIICGAPGSGKTTYVSESKGSNDIVIDLDDITSRISGCEWYKTDSKWLKRSIDKRNKMLYSLSQQNGYDRAWFIVSAPTAKERDYWNNMLSPINIIVMDVSEEECIRRIVDDKRRINQANRFIPIVNNWFLKYTPTL